MDRFLMRYPNLKTLTTTPKHDYTYPPAQPKPPAPLRHVATDHDLETSEQCRRVVSQVLLWKKNVDQVFEGVEECPICYTVFRLIYETHRLLA